MPVLRVKVLRLGIGGTGASLLAQRPLKVLHVGVVRLDPGLVGQGFRRGLVGELRLILLC